jgi:hypothetical protein
MLVAYFGTFPAICLNKPRETTRDHSQFTRTDLFNGRQSMKLECNQTHRIQWLPSTRSFPADLQQRTAGGKIPSTNRKSDITWRFHGGDYEDGGLVGCSAV